MIRRTLALAAATAVTISATAHAQRAIGIDVSAWQGTINWATVAKPVASGGAGVQFAFIRSSRGGTTGSYNQSTGVGTISNRYDDPYFVSNMNNATSNGVLAGAYHYARIDLVNNTDASDPTYAGNTGLDEANHFLQQAGNYMRPGYLRPVVDVEAGDTQTSKAVLTTWVLQFSDRILAATGVRPIVYINSNYANNEVDSRLNTHDLWLARYVDPTVVNIQTADPPPASGLPNVYGVWNPTYPTIPAAKPWDFWQYTSTGTLPGISGNVDHDVANGDINFVKEFLVPAIWNVDASGDWSTASNWNGVTTLPTAKDRVIVNRTAGAYTVTLASGTRAGRSLQMHEQFAMSGGSLTLSEFATFTNSVAVSGTAAITSATLSNAVGFEQSGGSVITGAVTGTGTLSIEGGTFRATSIRQGALTIGGGSVALTGTAANTSVFAGLDLSGTGQLDLGAAKVVVTGSTLASIRADLATGSIFTSSGGPAVGVAYFVASDLFTTFPATFGDAAVTAGNTLLMRALRGDTNASGAVDFGDLLAVAQHYGASGRWHDGDFNYDGTVDFADLLSLAQNYNTTLLDSSVVAGNASSFAADWALAQSLVPEPTTITLSLAGLAVISRRRR